MKKIRQITALTFQSPFAILGMSSLALIYVVVLTPLSIFKVPKKTLLSCLKPSIFVIYVGIRVAELIEGESK